LRPAKFADGIARSGNGRCGSRGFPTGVLAGCPWLETMPTEAFDAADVTADALPAVVAALAALPAVVAALAALPA